MQLRGYILKRYLFGYTLVAPAMIVMLTFFVWPVILGFLTSLRSGFGFQGKFVGLSNYIYILGDGRFWNSLRVSVLFTIGFLVVSGGLGLIIATFLIRRPRLYQFYGAAIYIPYISTPVIGALIWENILSSYGILNEVLGGFGIPPAPWLQTAALSLLSLIGVQVWSTMGYNSVLFLAGLQQIPKDYYEAAELEGCGWIRQLRYVTLPLIIPTITFVVTISTLYGFVNSYVIASLMTNGGPFEATNVLMLYIFDYAFNRFDFGTANAATILMFILFSGVAIIQFNYQKRKFVGLQ